MKEKAAGKVQKAVDRFKRFIQALEAITFVWGLVGLAGSTWAGLDPGMRGLLAALSALSVAAGGSALLYTGIRWVDARRGPGQPSAAERDRRTERIARLVDELKLFAGRLDEMVTDQSEFGLYGLIMNQGGGDVAGLYARTHVNGYGPIREGIAGFTYAPGRERDLISLAKSFEAHLDSHGEFLGEYVRVAAGRSDAGLFSRIGICAASYNHFIQHMRLWQDEFVLLVGTDSYHPRHLRPRPPPIAPRP